LTKINLASALDTAPPENPSRVTKITVLPHFWRIVSVNGRAKIRGVTRRVSLDAGALEDGGWDIPTKLISFLDHNGPGEEAGFSLLSMPRMHVYHGQLATDVCSHLGKTGGDDGTRKEWRRERKQRQG